MKIYRIYEISYSFDCWGKTEEDRDLICITESKEIAEKIHKKYSNSYIEEGEMTL